VKSAIVDHWGMEYYNSSKKWVKAISEQGQVNQLGFWEKAYDQLRTATSLAAMGYSLTTALVQPLGLFNTANKTGVYNTVVATMKIMKNPLVQYKRLSETYPEFNHLINMFDRDMKQQLDKEINRGKLSKAHSAIVRHAFYHIGFIQKIVNSIAYTAAENKYMNDDSLTKNQALDKIKSEVRTTQSMAGQKDLALVQTGAVMKMFTLFYSYFSVLYGQGREAGRGSTENSEKALIAAKTYTMLIILPSMIDTFMRDTCEEEDAEVACYAREIGLYTLAPIPFVRDILGGLVSRFDYKVTPIGKIGTDVVRARDAATRGFSKEGDVERGLRGFMPIFKMPPKMVTQPIRMYDADEWREFLQLKKPE